MKERKCFLNYVGRFGRIPERTIPGRARVYLSERNRLIYLLHKSGANITRLIKIPVPAMIPLHP